MRLIDADALMQTYAKFVAPSNNSDFENEPTWNDAVSLLESAPTVDPVKHGHWVYVGHGLAGESICKCSICGHQTPDDGNYCSYCGAKMEIDEKRD